jgi:hypothetical protein
MARRIERLTHGFGASKCGILAVIYSLAFADPAFAYLDPGTGSIILQGLLAFFATVIAAGSFYWQRIKDKLNSLFSRKQPSTVERSHNSEE